MTRQLSQDERVEMYRRCRELVDSGRVRPGYEGLSDEEAMTVIMCSTDFDELEARSILERSRGLTPGDVVALPDSRHDGQES